MPDIHNECGDTLSVFTIDELLEEIDDRSDGVVCVIDRRGILSPEEEEKPLRVFQSGSGLAHVLELAHYGVEWLTELADEEVEDGEARNLLEELGYL